MIEDGIELAKFQLKQQISAGNYDWTKKYEEKVKFLNGSIPYIQKRDSAEQKLKTLELNSKEENQKIFKLHKEITRIEQEIEKTQKSPKKNGKN